MGAGKGPEIQPFLKGSSLSAGLMEQTGFEAHVTVSHTISCS